MGPDVVELNGRLYQFNQGAYVDGAYFDLNDISVTRGSQFTKQEAEANETVLLISDGAADILFPDVDPVGKTLTLMPSEDAGAESPQAFRVIGTFADKNWQQRCRCKSKPLSTFLCGLAVRIGARAPPSTYSLKKAGGTRHANKLSAPHGRCSGQL